MSLFQREIHKKREEKKQIRHSNTFLLKGYTEDFSYVLKGRFFWVFPLQVFKKNEERSGSPWFHLPLTAVCRRLCPGAPLHPPGTPYRCVCHPSYPVPHLCADPRGQLPSHLHGPIVRRTEEVRRERWQPCLVRTTSTALTWYNQIKRDVTEGERKRKQKTTEQNRTDPK